MVAQMEIMAIATRPRGSWKYQDAFAVGYYTPVKTRRGVYVWRFSGYRAGCKKLSEPQLRRYGFGGLPRTPHNQPLTDRELFDRGLLVGPCVEKGQN